MNILVTGGAGFIGRWVVKKLLEQGHQVTVLDDLSNGRLFNIEEFQNEANFNFIHGDIKDAAVLAELFTRSFSLVYHLAASINVQDSIDDPKTTVENDITGTFKVLEECRKHQAKMVFMSTCMVYERSMDADGITETSPTKPASPYAASKLAGEALTLSYYYAYGLPTVVIRPFNTYGPFQKGGGEGGVVSVFIKRALTGQDILIYGEGSQTRDLLFVEDSAEFVIAAGMSEAADGQILNAGLGKDIAVNDLAALIAENPRQIKHIEHIHPQSEIAKLLCNYEKAKRMLGWSPKVPLIEGIAITKAWLAGHLDQA